MSTIANQPDDREPNTRVVDGLTSRSALLRDALSSWSTWSKSILGAILLLAVLLIGADYLELEVSVGLISISQPETKIEIVYVPQAACDGTQVI